MKHRLDFVTNSSSSSFVMAFTSKSNIPVEATKGMPSNGKLRIPRLLADLLKAKKMTVDEVWDEISEEVYWTEEFNLRYKNQNDPILNRRDYRETEEFKNTVKANTEQQHKRLLRVAKNKPVFTIIEYGDHTDGDMEHEIMPRHKNTVYVQSNH